MKRAFLLLTLSIFFQAKVQASEISKFREEWCARNQFIGQDVKLVCFGSAEFSAIGSTRAVAVQRRDGTQELFIENDPSSIDLLNLRIQILGPVASSKPRSRFARKYFGEVKLGVDANGEVDSLQGFLHSGDRFFVTR